MTYDDEDLDAELGEPEHAGPPAHQAGQEHTPVRVRQSQIAPGARNGSHFTLVVGTGSNPVGQLLGRDYDRAEAVVIAVDQPVVLAQTKEMAESASNTSQAVVGPIPSGTYLPVGVPVTLRHCDQVWVAATSATLGRVSVVVARTGHEHGARP